MLLCYCAWQPRVNSCSHLNANNDTVLLLLKKTHLQCIKYGRIVKTNSKTLLILLTIRSVELEVFSELISSYTVIKLLIGLKC